MRTQGKNHEHEALGDRLDRDLERYVSDYHINIFEIAFLTDEQVEKFQSDFKIVADYFVQQRKNGNYQLSDIEITHVRELLQLMKVLTGDERFEEEANDMEDKENTGRGPRTMCEVLDRVEQRGIIKGRRQGRRGGGLMMLIELYRDELISLEEVTRRSEKVQRK